MIKETRDMMAKLMERIIRLEGIIAEKDNNSNIDKKIEDMVESKVNEILTEKMAKEDRKLNLVLVNIPEAVSTGKEAVAEDSNQIKTLMSKILPEEEVTFSDPIRLGSRNAGTRPRMIKISVANTDIKTKIMKNSSKANDPPEERLFVR